MTLKEFADMAEHTIDNAESDDWCVTVTVGEAKGFIDELKRFLELARKDALLRKDG